MWAASCWGRASWMWALLLLLLQLLLAGPGGCLRRQELFPFGPVHGDLELEPGDDRVSPALELSTALRLFDKSDIHSVYVSALRAERGQPAGERGGGPSREGRKEAGGRGSNGAGRTWASGAGTDPLAAERGARAGSASPVRSCPWAPDVPIAEELAGLVSSSGPRGPVCSLLPPGPQTYGPPSECSPQRLCGTSRPGSGSRHCPEALGTGLQPGGARRARGSSGGGNGPSLGLGGRKRPPNEALRAGKGADRPLRWRVTTLAVPSNDSAL